MYELLFTIYASATGTNDAFANQTNSTRISNGLFTAMLDFGPGIFTGSERWLEIALRTNGSGACTIAGGANNLISHTSIPLATTSGGTIGGGRNNTIQSGADGTIAAGSGNQILVSAGGTIGGGVGNTVSGNYRIVPGGANNSAAGPYSLAAGRQDNANHDVSFVWSDPQASDLSSTAAN